MLLFCLLLWYSCVLSITYKQPSYQCKLRMAGISWDKLSTNLDSMDVRSPNALEQLLEEVNFQRRKDRRKCFKEGVQISAYRLIFYTYPIIYLFVSFSIETDYVILHGTPYWTDMFVRHFLFETDQSIDADDLLFFVRKRPVKGSTRFLVKFEVNQYFEFIMG